MKKVSELYGTHTGADIYIVGSGASLRVFPKDFFKNKITIGLNMAWKTLDVMYSITIHPDINIPQFIGDDKSGKNITWVVGNQKTQSVLRNKPEQLEYALENFYFFDYRGKPNTQPANEPSDSGRVIEWVETASGDNLYIWSSISQAAVVLAANMGAKNVVLVGCDNTAIGENHHAHLQHTRWKGVAPDHRYYQYYEGLAEVRSGLRTRGVNVVSMNPFLKLDIYEYDFKRLSNELGVAEIIVWNNLSIKQPLNFIKLKILKMLGKI
jgi:hypothetical protein